MKPLDPPLYEVEAAQKRISELMAAGFEASQPQLTKFIVPSEHYRWVYTVYLHEEEIITSARESFYDSVEACYLAVRAIFPDRFKTLH